MSWNQGAERLFGYSAEEMIGKSVTILIPAERQDEEPKILGRIRRGERMEHYETVRLRKDGSLVDISLSVSPVKDATGKVIGASKVARDITERKQAQAQVKEQWGQLTDDDLTQINGNREQLEGKNTGSLWLRQRPSEEGRGRLVEPVVTLS